MAAPIAPRPIRIDAHLDVPWRMQKHGFFQLQDGAEYSTVSLARLQRGGVTGAVCALYLPDSLQNTLGPANSYAAIMQQSKWLHMQEHCDIVKTQLEYQDVVAARNFPLILSLEGARILDTLGEPPYVTRSSIGLLQAIGVRYVTLTHNHNNLWADSATDRENYGGLSVAGKELVTLLNDANILVDVSHAADTTVSDVLDHSTRPIIASHSGCYSILDHPRNLSDSQIISIAQGGGVICIPFAYRFIGLIIQDVVEHIVHATDLVGPEHVGIGSDLDGATMVDGIEDIGDWDKVTQALSHYFSDRDIANIMGHNVYNLLLPR